MKEQLHKLFPSAPSSVETMIKYLERIGAVENPLNEAQLERLLVEMYKDFMNFTLDIDGLSDICGKFYILVKDTNVGKSSIAFNFSEFADIEWDIRNKPEEAIKALAKLKQSVEVLESHQ